MDVTPMAIGLVIAHPDTEQETHYQLVGILGEGGSGTTYQAQILGTEGFVALKQLSLKQMDDWKAIELFEREAKILSQLNHPGIPAYIDYFTIDTPTDRHFYIVQALAPGKTLSDWSESGKRYTEAEIKDIAVKVLRILRYLQKIQPPVIHRDIKPSNILRTTNGQISLVDFGAVRQAYHDTFLRGSTVVGTFGYMAPEQFRAQAVPATDLYGLGATILTLLTNRSPAELTQSNLKISFRDKIQVVPAFADWLERMLEPDRIDRFDSAITALAALRKPQSLAPKLSRRKLTAIGVAATISLGTLDYYKYYFLSFWGFTPMTEFISQQHDLNGVKSLLDRGVNPNAKDINGFSLLHHAVTNNHVEMAKLLIDRGADIHAHYSNDGHTVLHLAAIYQSGEMTQLLLDRQADPNVRDNFAYTPLHASILQNSVPYRVLGSGYAGRVSIKSVEYLLSHGADVNAIGGIVNIEKGKRVADIDKFLGVSAVSRVYYSDPLEGTPMTLYVGRRTEYDITIANHRQDSEVQKMLRLAGGKYSDCERNGDRRICHLTDTLPKIKP